eukprot:CAMPEP_0117479256 /NCGR_PEP_ID=MMETSP0784-20121206/11788_1 /TAXON_ID=39447 /ORGANISM="" /LENGTH=241 /DNA_ID=CAMNT_0005273671 /DNA_START=38 /DNA_END=763 /DNA_ORIENTATION=-
MDAYALTFAAGDGVLLQRRLADGSFDDASFTSPWVTLRTLTYKHPHPCNSSHFPPASMIPGGHLEVELRSDVEVKVTIPAGIMLVGLATPTSVRVPEGAELCFSTGCMRPDEMVLQAGVPHTVQVPYSIVLAGTYMINGEKRTVNMGTQKPFFETLDDPRVRPNVPEDIVATESPPRMTPEQRIHLQAYLNSINVHFGTIHKDFITRTVEEAFVGNPSAVQGQIAAAWHAWYDRHHSSSSM